MDETPIYEKFSRGGALNTFLVAQLMQIFFFICFLSYQVIARQFNVGTYILCFIALALTVSSTYFIYNFKSIGIKLAWIDTILYFLASILLLMAVFIFFNSDSNPNVTFDSFGNLMLAFLAGLSCLVTLVIAIFKTTLLSIKSSRSVVKKHFT